MSHNLTAEVSQSQPTARSLENTQLKSQFRIGSIHGRVSYDLHERVFHSSDVPEKARQAKQEVKEYILGDVLGITKPVFHPSTNCDQLGISYKKGCPWDDKDKVKESTDFKRTDSIAKFNATQTQRLKQAQELRDLHQDKTKLHAAVVGAWNGSTALDPRILKRKYIFPKGVSQHEVPLRLTHDIHRKDVLTGAGQLVATQRIRSAPLISAEQRRSLVQLAKEHIAEERIKRAQQKIEQQKKTVQKHALDFAKYDGAWDMYIPRPVLGDENNSSHFYESEAKRLLLQESGGHNDRTDKSATDLENPSDTNALIEDANVAEKVVDVWEREAIKKSTILIREEGDKPTPVCPHGIFVSSSLKVCARCIREGTFVNQNQKATRVAVQSVASKRRALSAAAAAASAKVEATAAAVAITGAEVGEATTHHEDPVLKAHAKAVENASKKAKELRDLQSTTVLLQPVPPRSAPLTRAAIAQSIAHRYSQEELEKFVYESQDVEKDITSDERFPPGAAFYEKGEIDKSSLVTARRHRYEQGDAMDELTRRTKQKKPKRIIKLNASLASSLFAEVNTEGFDRLDGLNSDSE